MYPFTTWADKADYHEYRWQGLRVPYCTLGEGPPIVLLHGLGLSYQAWQRNVDVLTRYGKVYALDLPGFGRSEKPQRILSCRELAEVALEWAEAIGLQAGVWLGHSLGGEVALWAGALKPELFKGIVLAGSTGLPPRPNLLQRLLGLALDGPKESLGIILRLVVSYHQATPWRMLQTFRVSDPWPLLRLASRLQMPVLVMHGMDDPVVSLEESRQTALKLPQGRLCLLDAPHAMIYSAAEEFNTKLSAFLEEILGPLDEDNLKLNIYYSKDKSDLIKNKK